MRSTIRFCVLVALMATTASPAQVPPGHLPIPVPPDMQAPGHLDTPSTSPPVTPSAAGQFQANKKLIERMEIAVAERTAKVSALQDRLRRLLRQREEPAPPPPPPPYILLSTIAQQAEHIRALRDRIQFLDELSVKLDRAIREERRRRRQ